MAVLRVYQPKKVPCAFVMTPRAVYRSGSLRRVPTVARGGPKVDPGRGAQGQ